MGRRQAENRLGPGPPQGPDGVADGGRVAGIVTDRDLFIALGTNNRNASDLPVGALMEKGLSVKSGQTHVQKYMPRLLKLILEGKLDTTFLISHRMSLEEAPTGYKMFKERQNEVTKVVLKPHGETRH